MTALYILCPNFSRLFSLIAEPVLAETSPVKPEETSPVKPEETSPVKLEETSPVKPSEEAPKSEVVPEESPKQE